MRVRSSNSPLTGRVAELTRPAELTLPRSLHSAATLLDAQRRSSSFPRRRRQEKPPPAASPLPAPLAGPSAAAAVSVRRRAPPQVCRCCLQQCPVATLVLCLRPG